MTAAGIASFGPVDLQPESPTFGYITASPKLAWQNFDLAGSVRRALGVPVGFDTDVNAAALGEARWGAGRGLSDFVYLTIGTGIGGGAVVNGRLIHGLVHPEMGHIRVPHDRERDSLSTAAARFTRIVSRVWPPGPRWSSAGGSRRSVTADHPAWALEAHYLALGLATWVCTLSPQRWSSWAAGVMQQPQLFP